MENPNTRSVPLVQERRADHRSWLQSTSAAGGKEVVFINKSTIAPTLGLDKRGAEDYYSSRVDGSLGPPRGAVIKEGRAMVLRRQNVTQACPYLPAQKGLP